MAATPADEAHRHPVVILGAGWAGLGLAHQILQNIVPKVPGLKLVLVSPSSHFFWNVASPRGIIPDAIDDGELFTPIAPAFDHYPPGAFEFVLGSAERIETATNSVYVRRGRERLSSSDGSSHGGSGDDGLQEIVYGHLVIATGSRVISNLPFKPMGSFEEHLDAWHNLQRQVAEAKTIVIAGGGPTGVEVAGELASRYGAEKEIVLVENGDHVLYGRLPSVRSTAERDLEKLGVRLIHNNRATQAEDEATSGTIHLSKGGTLTADLFLRLYGVVVNNSFIPDELMDWEGNLKLDSTLQVHGTDNIWGVGDVGNVEAKQLGSVLPQVSHLSKTLEHVLVEGRPATEVYKPGNKPIIMLTFGRRLATGQLGNWKVFGFIVSLLKGRRLFLNNAAGFIGGKARQPFA